MITTEGGEREEGGREGKRERERERERKREYMRLTGDRNN